MKCSFKYIYTAFLTFKQIIPLWKVLCLDIILLLMLVFFSYCTEISETKKDIFLFHKIAYPKDNKT